MYTYYYFIVVRQWTSQFSMLVDVKEDEKRKLIITYIQPAAFERRERDKKTYINRKEVKKSLLLLQYKKTQAFKEKKTVKKQKAFSLKNDTLWKKLHLGSTSSSTLLLSLSKKKENLERRRTESSQTISVPSQYYLVIKHFNDYFQYLPLLRRYKKARKRQYFYTLQFSNNFQFKKPKQH